MAIETPDLYVWQKANFPETSVGKLIMPDYLEGRKRPKLYVLESIGHFINRKGQRGEIIKNRSLDTFLDLLNADRSFVKGLYTKDPHNLESMIAHIDDHFSDIALGAEGRLMRALYGEDSRLLVPLEDEEKRRQALLNLISQLENPQARRLLDSTFGLNGRRIELKTAANKMSLQRERARMIREKAFTRIIQLNGETHVLDRYLTFKPILK